MIPKDEPVDVAAVYTELGEPPTADGYDVAHICSNPNGKIKPRAKFKPYCFNNIHKLNGGNTVDKFTDLTDEDLKSINYGMTVKGISNVGPIGNFVAERWGQWTPPTPGVDWCRINDFAGYRDKGYVGGVSDAMVYITPNNESDPLQPLENSYIGFDMTLTSPDSDLLSVLDFANNKGGDTTPFSEMCLTLILTSSDGSDLFGSHMWAVQSNKLGEYGPQTHNFRLRMKLTSDMVTAINNSEEGRCLYFACLCPPILHKSSQEDEDDNLVGTTTGTGIEHTLTKIIVGSPVESTGQIKRYNSGTAAISNDYIVSLNMWDDNPDTIHYSESIGTWTKPQPEPGAIREVAAYFEDRTWSMGAPGSNPASLHFTCSGLLPGITVSEEGDGNENGYEFKEMRVSLMVALVNANNSKIVYEGLASGDWPNVYAPDLYGDEFVVNIPDMPSGTYSVWVGLKAEASGIYYDARLNKSFNCILKTDDNRTNANYWEEIGEDFVHSLLSSRFVAGTVKFT